ncbi:MAG: hypothetical protein MHM6MM_004761 [Cercozoa sp. M6MM]
MTPEVTTVPTEEPTVPVTQVVDTADTVSQGSGSTDVSERAGSRDLLDELADETDVESEATPMAHVPTEGGTVPRVTVQAPTEPGDRQVTVNLGVVSDPEHRLTLRMLRHTVRALAVVTRRIQARQDRLDQPSEQPSDQPFNQPSDQLPRASYRQALGFYPPVGALAGFTQRAHVHGPSDGDGSDHTVRASNHRRCTWLAVFCLVFAMSAVFFASTRGDHPFLRLSSCCFPLPIPKETYELVKPTGKVVRLGHWLVQKEPLCHATDFAWSLHYALHDGEQDNSLQYACALTCLVKVWHLNPQRPAFRLLDSPILDTGNDDINRRVVLRNTQQVWRTLNNSCDVYLPSLMSHVSDHSGHAIFLTAPFGQCLVHPVRLRRQVAGQLGAFWCWLSAVQLRLRDPLEALLLNCLVTAPSHVVTFVGAEHLYAGTETIPTLQQQQRSVQALTSMPLTPLTLWLSLVPPSLDMPRVFALLVTFLVQGCTATAPRLPRLPRTPRGEAHRRLEEVEVSDDEVVQSARTLARSDSLVQYQRRGDVLDVFVFSKVLSERLRHSHYSTPEDHVLLRVARWLRGGMTLREACVALSTSVVLPPAHLH